MTTKQGTTAAIHAYVASAEFDSRRRTSVCIYMARICLTYGLTGLRRVT